MIISVLNTKGGCGKSTTSINIAAGLAERGWETLLVDTDEDGTSTEWSARRPGNNLPLSVVSVTRAESLRQDLRKHREKFDFLVLDGAPKLATLMTVSVAASDCVVIPVLPSPNDLWKLSPMVELVQQTKNAVETATDRKIQVFFLVNNYDSRTRLGREVIEALTAFPFPTLETRIGARVDYRDMILQGLSAAQATGKARKEASKLVEEIVQKLAA